MNKPKPQIQVDRQNAVHPEAFIFAKAEWTFLGDSLASLRIDGPKGSWTKPPELMARAPIYRYVFALTKCPSCGSVMALQDRVTKVDGLGKLSPDYACTASRCGFRRMTYLDFWNDKRLYCLMYVDPRKEGFQKIYSHATTQVEAWQQSGAGIPQAAVVGIAPAIGNFVDEKADKSGLVLTTD